MEAIPPEWENIVMVDNESVKKLRYIKLSGILWGVCREQESKIEHFESSAYEQQEALKEVIKDKPKAKAKPKAKSRIEK